MRKHASDWGPKPQRCREEAARVDDSESPPLGWPIAAAIILILLVTFLGGGVVLARLSQTGGIMATSSMVVATPRPTSVQPGGNTLSAALPRDETPTSGLLTTPLAAGQAAPVAQATPAANTRGDPPAVLRTPGPASTVQSGVINYVVVNGTPQLLPAGAPTPTPQDWWAQSGPVSPDLGNALGAAYQHFWDVRAQVELTLDPAPLAQVEDGVELHADTAALDDLRAQHQRQQINVQHHIQIIHATPDDAAVRDDYVSYAIPLDPDTNQPLTPTPDSTSHLMYHFQKLDGVWKVVDAVQVNP